MKDQYVIKLSDYLTIAKTVEGIVNDIRREIANRDAYRFNTKSYTLPTTIGMVLGKCTTILSISRMVGENEIKNTFQGVFERLYGEDYDSKVGLCRVIRAVSTFITPDMGSSWLKAEASPGGFGYDRLFGNGTTTHIVDVIAIRQILMEIEIEGVIYYGISRSLLVPSRTGGISVLRVGFCMEDEESIEYTKRFLDNEVRQNRWEENEQYDRVMAHRGVLSIKEEDEHYNLALNSTTDPKDVPFRTMVCLEATNDLLLQVTQRMASRRLSRAGNVSLN